MLRLGAQPRLKGLETQRDKSPLGKRGDEQSMSCHRRTSLYLG